MWQVEHEGNAATRIRDFESATLGRLQAALVGLQGCDIRMLIGIVSDVHGNNAGLEAVCRELRSRGVTEIVCCGDLTGYSAPVDAVLPIILREGIICVAGNHDVMVTNRSWPTDNAVTSAPLVHAAEALSEDELAWLAALPIVRDYTPDGRQIRMMHGAPFDPIDGYLHPHRASETRIPDGVEFLFVGHTHMQFRTGAIINAGSCGLGRDGDPRASCTMFDTETGATTELRVSYDPSSVAEANERAGFDPIINQYLFAGQKLPAQPDRSRLQEAASQLARNGAYVVTNAAGLIAERGDRAAIALSLIDGSTLIRSTPLSHYWEERDIAPPPDGFELKTSKVSTYYEMRNAAEATEACLQLLETR